MLALMWSIKKERDRISWRRLTGKMGFSYSFC